MNLCKKLILVEFADSNLIRFLIESFKSANVEMNGQ